MKNREHGERDEQLEHLISAVFKSPKYRNVSAEFIRNLGRRELSKRQSLTEAIKSTKNKLHQISGAYFLTKPRYKEWLTKLKQAKKTRDEDLFRKTCAEIMSHHHSTRGRLKMVDDFYESVFSRLPPVHSIVDLACGFHPLSIPWMPLREKMKYYAYDIYTDLTDFLNAFLPLAGVAGHAESRDIVQNPPTIRADLAFLLSTIPCLEQVEKSAGLKALESTNADFLVVSFPVRSLGGREKAMREYYQASFDKVTRGKGWNIQRLEFETELVFLIRKA